MHRIPKRSRHRHATRIEPSKSRAPISALSVDKRHLAWAAAGMLIVAALTLTIGEPAKANRSTTTVTSIQLPIQGVATISTTESGLTTATPAPAAQAIAINRTKTENPSFSYQTPSNSADSENAAQQATSRSTDNRTEQRKEQLAEQWKEVTIKSGDNLSMVFQRAGLSGRDVYNVVNSGAEGKALKKVFAGETLGFVIDNGVLQKVKRVRSPLQSVVFTRAEKGFTSEVIQREPEVRRNYKSAQVRDSLFLASERVDLPQNLTMNMANIFGGVIDFVLDVRADDHFTVLYEELFLDGEMIGTGNILAAQYINRGETYNAYRYTDSQGDTGYYNEKGVSMRKAFLRAPLDFTRISSSFNLRRLHPVTKSVRPHRGIDYAAPTGTPVFSAGDGRVIASSYSKANGKYVFVRHGEAYTTKYLHLSKRTVKKGQRVKQGQIIGKVGCTGICTGPHLHYEFLVNGVHRNPRTILKKLPKAKSLAKQHKVDFISTIKPLQHQLASISPSAVKLASRE